ncbi:TetR/AcrR family transcriptional regulator [Nocardia sp. NBC_01388]|uniref:TetR/AcrR family transcriptional regulator n=1 Tax=Nocardia sp. NBC_01388 TaxID=2903596 RepID=UPI0032538037
MATATPRFKRSTPAARKVEILAAARQRFSTQHYDAVSTAEIADELGINRGLLYHYFGTKRQLYLEVIRSTVRIPVLPPIPELAASGRLEDALTESVEGWLIEVEREREAYLAAIRLASSFGPDEEAAAMVQASKEDAVDVALRAMFDDPDAAPAAVRSCARALGALAETAVVEWLAEGHLSRDQVRVLLVQTSTALWTNIGAIMAPPSIRPKRGPRT